MVDSVEQEITSTKPEIDPNQLIVHDNSSYATLFDTARFNQAWRISKAFADSKMVPAHFQGNTAGVFVMLQLATRMDLDVFMVLQNTYMVHGKPGMETKLALALVNTRGPFKDPINWKFDNEDDPKECTAFAFLKSSGEIREFKLKWETVLKEKWYDKDGSKWKTMPKLMFMYRSAIMLIRTVCPEVIFGLTTLDELQDMGIMDVEAMEVPALIGPQIPQTEKIKEKLKRGKKAPETPQEASPPPVATPGQIMPEVSAGGGTEATVDQIQAIRDEIAEGKVNEGKILGTYSVSAIEYLTLTQAREILTEAMKH